MPVMQERKREDGRKESAKDNIIEGHALASTTNFPRDGLVNLPRVFAKYLHSDASIYCYGHAYASRMR